MIKPASYWALHKTSDAYTLGRIGLALAGREDELTPPLSVAEKALVFVIRQDSEWMDERAEAKKEKWRMWKSNTRARQKAGVNKSDEVESGDVSNCPVDNQGQAPCPVDNQGSCDVPLPSIHPSILPSFRTLVRNKLLTNVSEKNARANCASENLSQEEPPSHTLPPAPEQPSGRPAQVPTDEEATTFATQIGVPKDYVPRFMTQMEKRGWGYVNRAGNFVALNRKTFKSVIRSFYETDSKPPPGKPSTVYHQEGYKLRLGKNAEGST